MSQVVCLCDVIKRAQTKVDKDNTELIYYVGGEHFDSGELTVAKKGFIKGSTIGPMFYYGFKKGDFLLVSRNPHLKKAGRVDFDGICSEKTFVLESINSTVLHPDFLPFILQNDRFWEYAQRNKHGSTNFFLNWEALASYKFELPDLEKQRKLANILWSINNTIGAYKNLIFATDELIKSQFIEMFGNPLVNDKQWKTRKLIQVAPAIEYNKKIPSINGKCWLLNLDMIESQTGRVLGRLMVPIDDIGTSVVKFGPKHILYSKLRPYLNKVVVPDRYGYATSEIIPLLPDQNYLNPIFLVNLLRGNEFLAYIETHTVGTKMPRVQMDVFWNFNIILPPMKLQEQFVSIVNQCDKSKFELEQTLNELTLTYKRIIGENLG